MGTLVAVNEMLTAAGLSAVADHDPSPNADCTLAVDTLTRVSRHVQEMGWDFNTEHDVLIDPDNDGKLYTAADHLRVIPDRRFATLDLVRRAQTAGGALYLYSRKLKTFVVDQDVYVTLVRYYDFEDIPPHLQNFIAAEAAVQFYHNVHGVETTDRELIRRRNDAWASVLDADAEETGSNMLLDNALAREISGRNGRLLGI